MLGYPSFITGSSFTLSAQASKMGVIASFEAAVMAEDGRASFPDCTIKVAFNTEEPLLDIVGERCYSRECIVTLVES